MCSARGCGKHFNVPFQKHHCRWCGRVFCDRCAPRSAVVDDQLYRRCNGCRLPVVFRSFVNPISHQRESTPCQVILSFLTPKSITALLQSCRTMAAEFPVANYQYYPSIKARFPSFYEGACIGKGSFGTVYKCEDRRAPDRRRVALKRMVKVQTVTYTQWCKVLTELDILGTIHHRNVASLVEVFQTTEDLIIVMEAGEGGTARQAWEYVRKHNLPLEPFVAHFIEQVACGLNYLYRERRIVHRDIKFENIVLSADYNTPMIIDFGLAEYVREEGGQLFMASGTAGFAPPENVEAVVRKKLGFIATGEVMHRGDLFSLGVVAYIMLVQQRPLRSKRFSKMWLELQEGVTFADTCWLSFSPYARDLVRRLLRTNPMERPTYEEIRVHPFVTSQAPRMDVIVKARQVSRAAEDIEAEEEWVLVEPDTDEGGSAYQQFPRHGLGVTMGGGQAMPARAANDDVRTMMTNWYSRPLIRLQNWAANIGGD